MNLHEYLEQKRLLVDRALDESLPGEDNEPTVLYRAMRYSLFAGGKRIRPVLAMAAAEAVGGSAGNVIPLAVSLECIHTYSLVHDDLPAMDDDDMRRGRPSLHKAFGEAVAILAGDALLTMAFEVMSAPAHFRVYRPERLIGVIRELATAAGAGNLISGQIEDIMSEGQDVSLETIDRIVRGKTGALIRASLTTGALLAGGTSEQIATLGRFGDSLGAAFQIKDDLLDLEGDPNKLGKAVGKDEQRGKATYPNILGREEAKAMVKGLVESALKTIEPLGERAEPLALIGGYIGERVN